MSISPSSDLVLDVLRAADPASADAASARLATGAPVRAAPVAAAGEAFRAAFDRSSRAAFDRSAVAAKAQGGRAEANTPQAYRKFEAMVLQSFIKEMLPKDGQDVFGKGTAGDVWKSMLAEQIAGVVSSRGGIGIADHLLKGRFSGLGLEGAPRSAPSGDGLDFSRGLVHQLQMTTIDKVMPLGGDDDKTDGITG